MPPKDPSGDTPQKKARRQVMLCPNCRRLLQRGVIRCRHCGWIARDTRMVRPSRWRGFLKSMGWTAEPIPCPDCNVILPPRAKACMVCGWMRPVKRARLRRLLGFPAKPRPKRLPAHRRVCPVCTRALPRRADRCRHCGWRQDNWDATRTDTELLLRTTTQKVSGVLQSGTQRLSAMAPRRDRYVRPCPICEQPLPAKATRCWRCQWVREDLPAAPPSLSRRIARRLRGWRLRQFPSLVPCPNCQELIPRHAKKCGLCGWAAEYVRVPWRYRLPVLGKVLKARRARRGLGIMTCPSCNTLLATGAKLCLVCGWTAPMEPTLGNRVRLGVRAVRNRIKDLRRVRFVPCPECAAPILRSAKKCMACGWTARQRKSRPRRILKTGGNYVLCPNCCDVISRRAKQCARCGWTRQYHEPKRVFAWAMLAVGVVGCYFVFQQVLLMMAREGALKAPTADQIHALQGGAPPKH